MANLLTDHPAELEADLWDQGIALDDLFSGRLPVRFVATIASQLPPGARVWQAAMSDAAWTPDQYLIAEMIDELREANWIARNTGVDKHKQSPFPERIDRPQDIRAKHAKREREKAKAVSNRDFASTIEARRAAIHAREEQPS